MGRKPHSDPRREEAAKPQQTEKRVQKGLSVTYGEGVWWGKGNGEGGKNLMYETFS